MSMVDMFRYMHRNPPFKTYICMGVHNSVEGKKLINSWRSYWAIRFSAKWKGRKQHEEKTQWLPQQLSLLDDMTGMHHVCGLELRSGKGLNVVNDRVNLSLSRHQEWIISKQEVLKRCKTRDCTGTVMCVYHLQWAADDMHGVHLLTALDGCVKGKGFPK